MAYLTGRGDLIQIAAPDTSSMRLKRREVMSVEELAVNSTGVTVETILSASNTYIETLTIKPIEAQPWLIDLVIWTQLLTAKNPDEKRVKARCCIERDRLVELHSAIGRFLQGAGSSGEPPTH
jgi:hypothetical protein